ncbi:HIT family protein [Geomonas azotofigens]|uniref:HIT family protein n=1 Tax=Geomonas azotofigens TaxID=2843196 RepID=UPI001C11615D|nr:HIT family protein [Geomonas azotofigens]MBU5612939.1 HIT family protein [Geomonas azotofigens]
MSAEATCPFCRLDPATILLENEFARAFPDGFPVTLGHTLVVPKRHVASFFETTPEEQAALFYLVGRVRELLLERHAPDGFNIGVNDGVAAGQTVPHLHVHLIPRYAGDTDDPRGGVRWIMPVKAPYWKRDER